MIERVLGVGGFGVTYLAEHELLRKRFAIKEHFPSQFATRDRSSDRLTPTDGPTYKWALDRFLEEARILARCRHPNIVAVTDVLEANNTGYMILEYEEGESLDDWLRSLGRQPTQHELDALVTPLLGALAYVHARGLLHRDIAPDNILVRESGQTPCLIDFGAAREAVANQSRAISAIIKAGYSPPEQYARIGKAQGPWSDIYALAATLYRAVSGKPPPEATERHLEDELTPLVQTVADGNLYRKEFLAAIEAGLRLKPSDRPQTVEEFWLKLMERKKQRPSPLLGHFFSKRKTVSGPPPVPRIGLQRVRHLFQRRRRPNIAEELPPILMGRRKQRRSLASFFRRRTKGAAAPSLESATAPPALAGEPISPQWMPVIEPSGGGLPVVRPVGTVAGGSSEQERGAGSQEGVRARARWLPVAAASLALAGGIWGGYQYTGWDADQRLRLAAEAKRQAEERFPKVENYIWSASRRGNRVRIVGHVPDLATRQAILGAARVNFPDSEVLDRMETTRGVPSADAWLGGVRFALKQLTSLKRGDVRLDGLGLSVIGESQDVASYGAVKSALAKSLPDGIKLISDVVKAPVVSPFTWSAEFADGRILLAGYVPGEEARTELLATAKASAPNGVVVDRMQPGEGAPQGWAGAAAASVRELVQLESGRAEIKDAALAIYGVANDATRAEAVRAALRSALPTTIKFTDHIKAQDPLPTRKEAAPATPNALPPYRVLTPAEEQQLKAGDEFQECKECPRMVVVAAGSFTMGSPINEEARASDEGPQHHVTISKPFGVGKLEVTFAEWDVCVAVGGCRHTADDYGWGRGRRPVIDVSWSHAKEYVGWLSRRTGKTYRLLTGAEWEYAARAGTTTAFSTGSTITTDQANFDGNHTYAGSAKGEYRQRTVEVGSFSPNAFGLHDMHGNVREWVEDCYRYTYAGAPLDGAADTSGDCNYRLLRGGAWSSGPRHLRSAYRDRGVPNSRNSLFGLRVARTLAVDEQAGLRNVREEPPGLPRAYFSIFGAKGRSECERSCQASAPRCQTWRFEGGYCSLFERHRQAAADAARQRQAPETKQDTPIRPSLHAVLTAEEESRLKPRDEFQECKDCPRMVVLPAGEFTMGSEESSDEKPVHKVTIGKPFAAGKFEVTFAEWDACVVARGCQHTPKDGTWGRVKQPTVDISWHDAKEYAAWLSSKTGRVYRLLTESEWEYATRAGTTTRFSTGGSVTTDEANFDGNYTSGGFAKGVFRQRTIDVGSLNKPNPFGLHDMYGNVAEWVEDCYQNSYLRAPTDGSAHLRTDCISHVVRGGSWLSIPLELRSAYRASTRSR